MSKYCTIYIYVYEVKHFQTVMHAQAASFFEEKKNRQVFLKLTFLSRPLDIFTQVC